jgi:hypothetical protein
VVFGGVWRGGWQWLGGGKSMIRCVESRAFEWCKNRGLRLIIEGVMDTFVIFFFCASFFEKK